MRNNVNRNVVDRRRTLVAFLLFALVGAASVVAQSPRELAAPPQGNTTADGPQRVVLTAGVKTAEGTVRVKLTAFAKGYVAPESDIDFLGSNGTATGVSAISERKAFKFERATEGAAVLSCPTGQVKECDSLSLKDGGKLTACICLPPVQGSKQPATETSNSAAAEMSHNVALSDKSTLRSTANGGQTCWVNDKLQMSLCY